ncbi:MAG: efflux RND transporter permease subunit [Mangrovicoccus sp.]|nr:efflux RND transporter permease subunit [Mangrovicoccus sp.]
MMQSLTAWFIRNPVAANLVMALILFLGLQTALSMRIEGFPRIPAETIEISTALPNATAAQIDQQVTARIERALEGLDGVRSVRSRSGDEFSLVTLRKTSAKDLDQLLDAVRIRIDAIPDLPSRAERPVIEAAPFDLPALYINLHGDADEVTLQRLAQDLRRNLLDQPELSRIKAWGLLPREMRLSLDPLRLQHLGMTPDEVVARIQERSLEFQAGSLRTQGGKVFLRADSQARYPSEFAAIPIIERPDGRDVLMGDIAQISEDFQSADVLFRFNGAPTVGMEILVGRKENLLTISKTVRESLASFEERLPQGVEVSIWGDSSRYISERLALLSSNGIQGLILVVIMLSLFLDVRLAFWVAMGIPISVAGALAVSGSAWVDYSLNDVTTFGLIIALGILVDDAVVVGESVFEERQHNRDPITGTEAGVHKVALATIFGVATTIAAFFPMLMIDNALGKVLASFSGIVILALLFSLFESKFILPAHLAAIPIGTAPRSGLLKLWARVQNLARGGLFWFRDGPYQKLLRLTLTHRYAALLCFLAAAILGLGLIAKGRIATVFFPDIPGQVITVALEMDARAPFALTKDNLERIEAEGTALSAELAAAHGLKSEPIRSMFFLISNAQTAQMWAELTSPAERAGLGAQEITKAWAERVGRLPGTTEQQFTAAEELAGGFTLQLFGKDPDQLRAASAVLRAELSQIAGVDNIRDSLAGGQPQLALRLKPDAIGLGFTPESLARQVGLGFGGAEVQKIQRDGREMKVILRLEDGARDEIGDVLGARIRSSGGAWLPLSAVAEIDGGYVPGELQRFNGKLVNTVSATIDRSQVAPQEVAQAIFEGFGNSLGEIYPGVELKGGGELEEINEIQGGLKRALLLAVVLIYVLMAVPLKSYGQPLLILAIIPFGFIGAAVGHLIMGLPLSLFSFFGMLALAGVVVNDSLVMLTRYRDLRETGMAAAEAAHKAALSRFQAIFLTTATTVIGLLPLLTESSEQAQYLIPAAASLAFGELFGTALMLLLMPALLLISHDLFGNRKAGTAQA